MRFGLFSPSTASSRRMCFRLTTQAPIFKSVSLLEMSLYLLGKPSKKYSNSSGNKSNVFVDSEQVSIKPVDHTLARFLHLINFKSQLCPISTSILKHITNTANGAGLPRATEGV